MQEGSSFGDADAQAAWDAAADAWEAFIESGADYYRHAVHGPALLAACLPVEGRDVLDVGCGQGFFSRQLADRGARVVGIDLSEKQIAYARRHEALEPGGIVYHVMPAAEAAEGLGGQRFDLVAACMSLHDMSDPPAVLRSVSRLLPTGGRLVFSTPHPCTDTPYRHWERDDPVDHGPLHIDRYFESGPTVLRWKMGRLLYHWDSPYWRHTLEEWSVMVAEAGFLMRRLLEPRPTEAQVIENPHLEDAYRLPAFLIVDAVRQ